MKKIKILLFGASEAGKNVLAYLSKNIHILAFIDNDSCKIGKELNGYTIINPLDILNYEYDYIIITSTYNEKIYQQLINIGISEDKIIILNNKSLLDKPFPWDAITVLFILISTFLIFSLIY